MNIKILRISLYSKDGERRDIKFNLSGLSVIIGGPQTGKSSLLDIVDYCLGSSECNVAHGRIRDTVLWYSITLQLPDSQVFIARKAPDDKMKASNDFLVNTRKKIVLPFFNEIKVNTSKNDVLGYLTRLLGIPKQITDVLEDNSISPIKISFEHSKYLYFQSQSEIASKKLIFHRQDEASIPHIIKGTLPYFIGAIEDNHLGKNEKLRKLKKEITHYKKRLKELESTKNENLKKARELLAEAISVNLYEYVTYYTNEYELIDILKNISNWIPDENKFDDNIAERIALLDRQYENLLQEKRLVNVRVEEVKAYDQAASNYELALSEQKLRLRTIGLFKELAEYRLHHEEYVSIFEASLAEIDKEIGSTTRTKPSISKALLALSNKQKELANIIKNNRTEYINLKNQDDKITNKEKLDINKAKVIGRISLCLDSINFSDATARATQQQINILIPQIEELEEVLDPNILKEKLDSKLNHIGSDMTKWARELGLEHSEYKIRLDVNKLAVVADTPTKGCIPLYQMGGGANYVGYHLVTYIALAKWFKQQNRPVANFLFLDQPTQVYFPSEMANSGDLSEIAKDEDREAVHRMFKWLHKVCEEELGDSYQIIVIDHVNIKEYWFQEAICDREWRGEFALIPKDWL